MTAPRPQCDRRRATALHVSETAISMCLDAYLVSQDEEDAEVLQHGTLSDHLEMKHTP